MPPLRSQHSLVAVLTLATTLFSLLVFVVVGAVELLRERDRLLQTAARDADSALTLSAPPMAQALWNFDTSGVLDLAQSLVQAGSIVEVEVRAVDTGKPVRVQRTGWAGGGTFTREVPLSVAARDKPIGQLRVTESVSAINQQIVDQALARMPIELLKVAATAAGMLWLLHRLVTRRLLSMVRALESLRTDDPLAHLPAPPGLGEHRDEIVVLAESVNRFHQTQAVEVLRRREAEDHLREQLQQRSVILGSLRDAILTPDSGGRVRFANPACATLLGCTGSWLQGRNLAGLARVQRRDDAPGTDRDLEDVVTEARSRPGERSATLSLVPAQAPPFDAQLLANEVDGIDGATWCVVLYDVSESSRRQQAEHARERAEAASLAKTLFLSRMSHELRTPLNAIVGFAQTLENAPAVRADPQCLTQLQFIGRAGWHLTHMIGDLLELSRIEAGSLRLELQPLDLRPLLTDAVAYLRGEAEAMGIVVELQVDPAACQVQADAVRLEQVLVNLLSNAIKYNRPGGRVLLSVGRLDPDRVQLRVQDEGLGLDESQRAQLFQSFNRLGRETSGLPGTGIGLVVTRSLLQLMGGAIEVESQPGAGSTFSVVLQAAGPARPAQAAAPSPLAATANPGYGARRVLYIEDDAVNAQVMLALLMQRPQVQARVCDTLEAGWSALMAQTPDLLLLDMHLPDGSGLELLRRLRENPGLATLPVLVVSADAMDNSMASALSAGAQGYITKPLDFSAALGLIDTHLQARLARRPAH